MTCTLKRPEPQTLFDRVRNLFSANVLGGATIIPESNEWYVVQNDYAAQEMYYSLAEQMWRERDARYACCDNLVEMAARDGIYPRPASHAQGYVKITGVAGSAIPTTFNVTAGTQTYTLAPGARIPTTMPSTKTFTARIVADNAGSQGNGLGSTSGKITTSIAGIDQNVQVCGGYFCGGRDAETCDEFRERYIRRKSYQPRANMAWLKEKALEWPCVTRVCVRNCTCCEALFDLQIYAMFDDTFPNGIAPPEAIEELSEWLFGTPQGLGLGQVEIGVFGKVYAVTPARFDIVIDGLQCISGEQVEQIKTAVTDAMKTLCPSERLCARTIDLIIAQIAGVACDFCVLLNILDPGLVDENGDLVPDCDVLPVMNDVIVLAEQCSTAEPAC